MVAQVTQPPASLAFWRRSFLGCTVRQIWGGRKIKGNSIEAEDNDFHIRHNKLFSKVILHRVVKEVEVLCDVCNSAPETMLHWFCECPGLAVFFQFLKRLLITKLGLLWSDNDKWELFILVGYWRESRVRNEALCKFLLSQARRTIRIRRNLAFRECRLTLIEPIFKAIVKKQILYCTTYSPTGLPLLPLAGNSLVSVGEGGKLRWDWG